MNKRTIYSCIGLAIIVFFTWLLTETDETDNDFSEIAKISLREAGNQLLLSNQDSISLILPVVELESYKFELSFQNQLLFSPTDLVTVIKSSLEKSDLSQNYRVEVIQCLDDEVAYSYEMSENIENTIIPCAGRYLAEQCYKIQVRFLDKTAVFFTTRIVLYVVVFIVFLLFQFFFYQRKTSNIRDNQEENYSAIGSFHFYPEQNKLVKEATEISLSKKECELLEIFVTSPNQIIKREDLMKKVWEDNGVFVGRSLDTYISKLRKKLQEDSSIKITNVHGVGYKLEIRVAKV